MSHLRVLPVCMQTKILQTGIPFDEIHHGICPIHSIRDHQSCILVSPRPLSPLSSPSSRPCTNLHRSSPSSTDARLFAAFLSRRNLSDMLEAHFLVAQTVCVEDPFHAVEPFRIAGPFQVVDMENTRRVEGQKLEIFQNTENQRIAMKVITQKFITQKYTNARQKQILKMFYWILVKHNLLIYSL